MHRCMHTLALGEVKKQKIISITYASSIDRLIKIGEIVSAG